MNMTITAWFNSKKLNNNYYRKVMKEGDVFYATIYHYLFTVGYITERI